MENRISRDGKQSVVMFSLSAFSLILSYLIALLFAPYYSICSAIIYEIGLILMIFAISSKFSLLSIEGVLGCSVLLYFYQSALDYYFIMSYTSNPYFIVFDDIISLEARAIHIFIIILFILFFIFLPKCSAHKCKELIFSKEKTHLYKRMMYIALILCIFIIIINFVLIGGINDFLTANKMQRHEATLPLLKYEAFFYIYFVIAFCKGSTRDRYLMYVVTALIIAFSIISGDRRLVMNVLLLLWLLNGILRQVTVKWTILAMTFGLVLFALLSYIKFIYPAFAMFLSGQDPIWWYSGLEQKYLDAFLFNGEFHAHMEVLYKALAEPYRILDVTQLSPILNTFVACLPLSRSIVGVEYSTVGQIFQESYNVWSGMASAPFISAYLEFSFLGLIVIYGIYFLIFKFIRRIFYSTQNFIVWMFAIIFLIDLSFSIHRNELPGLLSGGYVAIISVLFVYIIGKLICVKKIKFVAQS